MLYEYAQTSVETSRSDAGSSRSAVLAKIFPAGGIMKKRCYQKAGIFTCSNIGPAEGVRHIGVKQTMAFFRIEERFYFVSKT